MRRDDPTIGRYPVTGLDQHEVARHEVVNGHELRPTVPPDTRRRAGHLTQRRKAAFRAELLDEAEHRVDGQNDRDDSGVLPIADEAGQHRANQQHDDEQVAELVDEQQPRRTPRGLDQAVVPHLIATATNLAIREATGGVDAEALDRLVHRAPVPRRCGGAARRGRWSRGNAHVLGSLHEIIWVS